MKKELICISCPQGCRLTAEYANTPADAEVTGNRCPRGKSYAITELTDPRRVVTAVVPTDDAARPVLPVRTSAPFPKGMIAQLLNELYKMQVATPIKIGSVILADALGTGIDVISAENRD